MEEGVRRCSSSLSICASPRHRDSNSNTKTKLFKKERNVGAEDEAPTRLEEGPDELPVRVCHNAREVDRGVDERGRVLHEADGAGHAVVDPQERNGLRAERGKTRKKETLAVRYSSEYRGLTMRGSRIKDEMGRAAAGVLYDA